MNKLNITDIKQKMFKKLNGTGWDKFFKSYIFSSDLKIVLKNYIHLHLKIRDLHHHLKIYLEHLRNVRIKTLR